MKINLTEEMRKNSKVGRLVFSCLVEALNDKYLKEFAEENTVEGEGVICEVNFTCNGIKLDLENFIKQWENGIEEEIKDVAADLVKGRLGDINSLLYDLEQRLESEIDKRLEDWERE